MNIKQAKQEIRDTVAAYLMKDEYGSYVISAIRQRPILLIGPPGIGKTQIMEQIAQECQIGLVAYTITHHTRQSAIGLPFIEHRQYGGREYAVTEYTMSEIVASIYNRMEQTGLAEGILFIDEINCVSETLAPTMLQFLQGKSFGNHRIPEGWIIVAAGNPAEYNKSVRDFDVVTLDRVRRITVEPDYAVWREYALRQGIHPAICAYLNVRQQYFCQIETTVDGRMFATPRGWEDLSELVMVYEKLGRPVGREVVMEYIQFPKIARDFANYLELYHKYQGDYQVEKILRGETAQAVFDKLERAAFDERVSVVSLVLAGLNTQFREVCRREDMLKLLQEKLQEYRTELQERAQRSQEMPGNQETRDQEYQEMSHEDRETREDAAAPAQLLAAGTEEFRADQGKRTESGLMSREERIISRTVLAKLETYAQKLATEDISDGEAAWERLRELFGEDSDAYEDSIDTAGALLEHAFDFMEGAFGNGQEMVLFVTELNTGFYSVRFLQTYERARYYEYNRNLLFSEEEREIGERVK
ncbi:MAG: AAA family ATPase [Clostridiales bacterium]|nr:AAA family ATPase [Clostridiales bacterium]